MAHTARGHQAELKAFLRERRAAIRPEEVGLPARSPGRGRSATGLSQEDLDRLTGRSLGEYNRFETGKRIPGRVEEYLEDLARALHLNEQEWTVLWRLAMAKEPPQPLHLDSGKSVPGMWRDVIDATSGGIMAYINDSSWNLLTFNEAFAELFPARKPPSNTMRWMLFDPQAREETLMDWSTRWAPQVIPQLQHAVQLRRNDPVLRGLEEEALDDPVVGPMYKAIPAKPIPYPDGSERPLRHATLGSGWVSTCVAEPVTSPGVRLMMLSFRAGTKPAKFQPLRATTHF